MSGEFSGKIKRYGQASRRNLSTEDRSLLKLLFGSKSRLKPSEVRERHRRFYDKINSIATENGWKKTPEIRLPATKLEIDNNEHEIASLKRLRKLEGRELLNVRALDQEKKIETPDSYGPIESLKTVYKNGGTGRYGYSEQHGVEVELEDASPATTEQIVGIMEEEYGRHDEELFRHMPDP